jgi:hypothetical protein
MSSIARPCGESLRRPLILLPAFHCVAVRFCPADASKRFLIAHPWLMASAGFIANGRQGMAALVLVLIPTESSPARFHATAIGAATLVGEIFGGTIAPAISGVIADGHGLAAPLWIAASGAALVFLSALFLRETAPSWVGTAHS